MRIIQWSCHARTTILSLLCYYKIKGAFDQQRYGRVYYCKHYLIIGSHDNWIKMNYIYDGTVNMGYKFINQTIIDGDVINISVIVIELKYGAIDADDSTCHGYYINILFSSTYIIQYS